MTEERKRPAPMAYDSDDDVEMEILGAQLMATGMDEQKIGSNTTRRSATDAARLKRREPPEVLFGDARAPEPLQKRIRQMPEAFAQQALQGTACWNKLVQLPEHILTSAVLAFLNTADSLSRERKTVMGLSKTFYKGVRTADRLRNTVVLDFKWNRFFSDGVESRKAMMALAGVYPNRTAVRTLRISKCESFFASDKRNDDGLLVANVRDYFSKVEQVVIDNEQRGNLQLRDVRLLLVRPTLHTLVMGHVPLDFFPRLIANGCPALRHLTLGSSSAHLDHFVEWTGLDVLQSLTMTSMRPSRDAKEIAAVLRKCKNLTLLDVGVDFDERTPAIDNNTLVRGMLQALPAAMQSINITVDNPHSRVSLDAATLMTAVVRDDRKTTRFADLHTLVLDVFTNEQGGGEHDEDKDVVMSAPGDSKEVVKHVRFERERETERKHEDMRVAVCRLLEACRMIRHLEIEAPYLLTNEFMVSTRDLAYGLETLSFIPEAVRSLYRPLQFDLTTYCNWRGSHSLLKRLSLPRGKPQLTIAPKADVSGLVQRAAANHLQTLRLHLLGDASLSLFAPVIERGKAIRHLEITGSRCTVTSQFLQAFRGGSQVVHLGTTETPFALRTIVLQGDMDFADYKSWATMVHACPQLEDVELQPTQRIHPSVIQLLRALVANKTAKMMVTSKFATGVGDSVSYADIAMLAQLMDATSLKRKWNYCVQVSAGTRNEAWNTRYKGSALISDDGSFETLVNSSRQDSNNVFLVRWTAITSRRYLATITRGPPR